MDQDSDYLLSSASEMADEDTGTRYDMPEDIYEQNKCLYRLANSSNEMYGSSNYSDQQLEVVSDVDEESDEDSNVVSVTSGLTSQPCEVDRQSENVHMACIQEFHHYQVDRVLEDGEPSNDDDDDYPIRDVKLPNLYEDRDGQLWSYNEQFIECDHAIYHGWNCESPVERHLVESEAPELIQNSEEEDWMDNLSDDPKYGGEDDKEEEYPTDKLLDK
jgi:hypothetical protein